MACGYGSFPRSLVPTFSPYRVVPSLFRFFYSLFPFSFLFPRAVPCSSGKCETPLSLVSFLLFTPFESFSITLARLTVSPCIYLMPICTLLPGLSIDYTLLFLSPFHCLTSSQDFYFPLHSRQPCFPLRELPLLSFSSVAPSLACHIPCGIRGRSDRPEYHIMRK